MTFSEKMRESLGVEGARIEVTTPEQPLTPGSQAKAQLMIYGGTRPAKIDTIIVRIVEADRHWVQTDGTRVDEQQAQSLPDRRHLTAGWDRFTVGEQRVELGEALEPGQRRELELDTLIPESCKPSSASCSHTLNVQADIKGQIDPTANARIRVAASG